MNCHALYRKTLKICKPVLVFLSFQIACLLKIFKCMLGEKSIWHTTKYVVLGIFPTPRSLNPTLYSNNKSMYIVGRRVTQSGVYTQSRIDEKFRFEYGMGFNVDKCLWRVRMPFFNCRL